MNIDYDKKQKTMMSLSYFDRTVVNEEWAVEQYFTIRGIDDDVHEFKSDPVVCGDVTVVSTRGDMQIIREETFCIHYGDWEYFCRTCRDWDQAHWLVGGIIYDDDGSGSMDIEETFEYMDNRLSDQVNYAGLYDRVGEFLAGEWDDSDLGVSLRIWW